MTVGSFLSQNSLHLRDIQHVPGPSPGLDPIVHQLRMARLGSKLPLVFEEGLKKDQPFCIHLHPSALLEKVQEREIVVPAVG